jgi:3-hydroxy-9,10-secoandrosta-1,3,5(10)-triene-9,17-dione monooxygenase reductase component
MGISGWFVIAWNCGTRTVTVGVCCPEVDAAAQGRPGTRATIPPRQMDGAVTDTEIDSRRFRDVMGRFATGVTVVTVAHEGVIRGMTANAFSSVSADPAMLLICIDQHSSMYPIFQVAEAFGVNILTEEQEQVSRSFAQRGEKRQEMGGYPYRFGRLGAPILDGVLAWSECRVEHRYRGGDHIIVVGRVEDMAIERPDAAPLLFFGGQYHALGDVLRPGD